MDNSINDRIRIFITNNGLKNIDVAHALNVNPSFISHLISGKRNASDRTIADICRVYHVREEWLREGKGEMFVKKTREEEIGAFLGDVISGDNAFKQAFVATLAELNDDGWKLLQEVAFQIVKKHQEIQSEQETKKSEP